VHGVREGFGTLCVRGVLWKIILSTKREGVLKEVRAWKVTRVRIWGHRMRNGIEYPSSITCLTHGTLFVVGMIALHLLSCVRNLCGSRF